MSQTIHNLAKTYGSHKFTPFTKHYFPIFEQLLAPYIDKECNILEIGVKNGASIKMWFEWLPKSNVFGIDINANPITDNDRFTFFRGDQANENFLDSVIQQVDCQMDIIIDDGGHKMDQQQISFKKLFPIVKSGGIYIIEDLCTSYWDSHGGGIDKSGTTMEYLKSLVDGLTTLVQKRDWLRRNTHAKNPRDIGVESIHFYDSLCVLKHK